ncbi:MAG: sugar ABC transporter ATP-binding protein [Clostridia bacterium]|nr:sugar ABC transporter ATP-binding protein [Clostridia bacterium]
MALLEMRAITKTFPGVRALDNVNLRVEEGEIHALVGENGAGKSTLMKVLSGIHPYGTYEGDILFDGNECRFQTIRDSERLGIVIIHQELALVPYLTIAENMFLGNEQRKMKGIIDWDATYANAEKYMRIVGLEDSPRELIKNIGTGKQQLVEIAKALAKNVRLLILDEPTSSLTESDSKKLLDLLLEFKQTRGITSIIISHKLNEVAYVSDHITVIRDGKTIETLDKNHDDFTEARIIKGMVGREITDRFPKRHGVQIGEKSLEIRNWTVHHPLYPERKVVDDVSIYLRKGEVVGIAGLIGAGRTELCQSVFGKAYGTQISGHLYKDGKEIHLNTVSQAVQAGLAYVTEDRKGDGLVLSNSIKHNITLSRLGFVSSHGVLDADKELSSAEEYRQLLNIKTPSVEQYVNNLSGGNQQKVLVAKWMYAKPEIMMLDEPTRGIDVGAKYEIYCIINDMAAEGKSILMVSSELPELLGMCDRIYVMCEGKLIGELPAAAANQEIIMQMIMEASKTGIGTQAE